MTPEHVENRIDRILVLKEWLDNRVAEVFTDYCNTFGIHRAYGVESYQIGGWGGDDLRIVQDTSARGCHNSEYHALPVQYLYLERPERLALMAEHKAAKDEAFIARQKKMKEGALAKALSDVQRLSKELSE
jgi:hypothetical protein